MNLQIININLKKCGNQIIPILFNENTPSLLILKYLTIYLYKKSYSTQYNHIYSIKLMIIYYNDIFKIDLENEIINGRINMILTKLNNYILYLNNNHIRTLNQHISNIGMFLIWCNQNYISNISFKDVDIYSIIQVYKTSNIYKTSYDSLSEKCVLNVLELINYESHQNPFVKRNRIRNFSIVLLLLETGLRLGELLKIKTKDFIRDANGIYLNIKNRNQDNEDSRKLKPQLKNNYGVRIIGVSFSTYNLIDLYILKHRKRNSLHTYLYTSDVKGKPLSKNSVSNIFKVISKHLDINFTPHVLRHYFAEMMLQFLIENKGIDMERAKDELRGICGWSMNSNMPNIYAKNYISKLANNHNFQRLNDERNSIA